MFRMSLRVLISNRRCLHMEYSNVIRPVDYYYSETIDNERIKLLSNLLGISNYRAAEILKTTRLKNKSERRIIECHDICMKHGIDKKTLSFHPNLLSFMPAQLDKRIHFFKDAGCQRIFAKMIISFHRTCNLSIHEFKLRKMLPQNADVPKNLLKCIDLPEIYVSRINPLTEDLPLSSIYEQILKLYLQWKLELTPGQLELVMKSQHRQRLQSLTLIKKSLDLLENEVGLNKLQIRQNCGLITKSPTIAKEVLNELVKFDTFDTKNLINKYPRILQVPVAYLRSRMEYLKLRGIRNEAISIYASILYCPSFKIGERITEFHSLPLLRCLWSHPRILFFIYRLPVVKKRIVILKQLKVRCSSLNILSESTVSFNKYISLGTDRTKGKDLLIFLSHELGVEVNVIRTSISRHPLWCYVSVFDAQGTFYFLEKHYSKKAIMDNVQIVLYPCYRVKEELDIIDSTTVDNKSWNSNQSRKLALCLYRIEKYHHFNGNGIWDCEQGKEAVN